MQSFARFVFVAAFVAAGALAGCVSDADTADAGTCPGDLFVCDGRCVDTRTDGAHCGRCDRPCGAGERCVGGRCDGCPGGLVDCDHDPANGCEADLWSDSRNCGACGASCSVGGCTRGACLQDACFGGQTRCGVSCVDTSSSAYDCGACDHACDRGESCERGVCTCAGGRSRCGSACVDTRENDAHCGACGRACGPNTRCDGGACVPGCRGGALLCAGVCVDPRSDVNHCGECGRRCGAGQRCEDGRCHLTTCPAGTDDCDGNPSNACETSLATDAVNCGGCGRLCPLGARCEGGACACPEGQSVCGAAPGFCTSVRDNPYNCGDCGRRCIGEMTCVGSACVCPHGESACADGRCFDLQSDVGSCGRCFRACAPTEVCVAGECGCPAGTTQCAWDTSTRCVDVRTDGWNCGACGVTCRTDQVCAGGRCGCPEGMAECGGRCVDVTYASTRCGACDVACSRDRTCAEGRCVCPTGTVECAGACVSTATSAAHCGRCGHACSAPAGYAAACREGECAVACPSGRGDCDGVASNGCETDLTISATSCGRCGRACAAGGACSGGMCPGDRWAFALGGGSSDEVTDIAVLPDGGLYAVGTVSAPGASFGAARLATSNPVQGFVVAVTRAGDVRWVQPVGGSWVDEILGVAVDASGNVFVVGSVRLSDRIDDPAAAFLASFSSAGVPRWTRRFSSATSSRAEAVAVDRAGNLHVSIEANGPVDLGAGPVGSALDLLLASFTGDGAFRHVIRFTGDERGDVLPGEVAFGPSGDGVVVGSFRGTVRVGALSQTAVGETDGFVAGITSGGAVRWLRAVTGSSYDDVSTVAIDGSGDALIGGTSSGGVVTYGAATFARSLANEGVFVARIATDGALRWSRRYAARYGHALRHGVAFGSAGEALLASSFRDEADFGAGPIMARNGAFVVRHGAAGDQRAVRLVDLPEELYSLVAGPQEDALFFGGTFGRDTPVASSGVIEGMAYTGFGNSDGIVMRLAP